MQYVAMYVARILNSLVPLVWLGQAFNRARQRIQLLHPLSHQRLQLLRLNNTTTTTTSRNTQKFMRVLPMALIGVVSGNR